MQLADNFNVEAMKYDTVDLSPLCYMDNISNMCAIVTATQVGNKLMEEVVGKKGLEFNYEKSMFMVMGNKKSRARLEKEIEKSPIMLGDQVMKEVKVMKYLGENISFNLEESVHHTVTKRAEIAKHTIYELRTVIEDTRATTLGGLDVAFNIWNAGILPMILWK